MRVGISASGSIRRYGGTVVAVLLLAGCANGATLRPAEQGEPVGSGSGCPAQINRIVDTETPATAETILALDFSGSFLSTDAGRERIRSQARALVEQSVERGQALRILAFTRTASGANTIVACPSLTAKYNNAAARSRKIENLKRKATAAVDVALESAITLRMTQKHGRGTSIVGGFLAIAESASQVRPGTPRDAVMFSDGQGMDEDATLDLSGFRTVGIYGVGANAGLSMDTPTAIAAAARWSHWLTEHGANSPNASTQAMF